MTTFLLVPGLFMGGWAWAAVAAELTARRHRAVPVTLPGLAERAGEDPVGVGLGEHTDAVAALLDAEGPGIVLVAHSYGIFPALAAADRRPGQVARVVFVDTGFPEPGESVVAQMPQLGLLDRALDGVVPVPEEIPAVHAVPPAELERYHRLATPHPVRTVTEPIELTGAWLKLPTTGVFCLANGLSLEFARTLHDTGLPRFAKLAEPGVTFFELATGHYPMLSTPVELADVLVRAAAGEGVGLYEGRPSAI
ncbi:alpha/beta fold hydrolase [Streptomyces olivochromogenes]|uniref:alpha/beta fold hydrolase n=1 Tax=Streptomyces olivochromogenes TaxID=1963 RepID=UPI001F1D01CD|nr:alpha/beta hydrolase [Streptomyces olivochromogenes]MCF3131209.1 alpha/beta hydrolase [Streptomyces olivochromogenes]